MCPNTLEVAGRVEASSLDPSALQKIEGFKKGFWIFKKGFAKKVSKAVLKKGFQLQ